MVHEYVYNTTETSMALTPISSSVDRGIKLWNFASRLAYEANRRITGMLCVFDLEWNSNDAKSRYTEGQIVDAHFEEMHTGWILHSGTINPYPEISTLSPFLQEHGYTIDMLSQSTCTLDEFRQKLHFAAAITENCIFSAYNGVNADMNILHWQGIYLGPYLDASLLLNGGKSIGLSKLYHSIFNASFDAHNAWSDTRALLDIMHHKRVTYDKAKKIWDVIKTIY